MRHGRAFSGCGFYKSVGYTADPHLGGLPLLFIVMPPSLTPSRCGPRPSSPLMPLPRARQTVVGLARQRVDGRFVRPTIELACTSAVLSAGVGFLPVAGRGSGFGPVATVAVVSLLPLSAAFIQPRAGRALDCGRIPPPLGRTPAC